jgi:large subunit ribosomal protein L17
MRHGKKINHLGRKTAHRKAMLANMACSLIERKRINTTLAKAKALRQYVEPLLTKSKEDSTHSRRVVFSYLQNKDIVSELFRDVAPKIATREGGYTRILKTGNRLGDNAEMCFIELVDFNETYTVEGKDKKATTRRSRRGGKTTTEPKASAAPAAKTETAAPAAEVVEVVEAVVEETPAEAVEEVKTEEVDAVSQTEVKAENDEKSNESEASDEEEKKD